MKPFLKPGGWQQENSVYWKDCRFEMCSHVKDRFSLESVALTNTCIQKSYSVSDAHDAAIWASA